MEQPRERPSDNQEQKEYFSGKKRQHTFKNQFVTLPEGKDIVDVEVGEKSPNSDISLFREQQEKFDNSTPSVDMRASLQTNDLFKYQSQYCSVKERK